MSDSSPGDEEDRKSEFIQSIPPTTDGRPVKEALSPSVAESIRTVFSAFVWHENILIDTIAAASFLKFHPNLCKTEDIIKSGKISLDPGKKNLRKKWMESVKSHRHSMDVALSSSSTPPVNSNLAWNNANETSTTSTSKSPSKALKEETPCPPTLRLLAVLWEEIRSYCIHAILQQVIVSANPLQHMQSSSRTKTSSSVLSEKRSSKTKARLKSSLKSKEQQNQQASTDVPGEVPYGQLCEMCGQYFGYPVTYHMRLDHPGCGSHAGGKGYNSGGNYCKGWAGNCGDGGVGGSSWYLICSGCRDNYMKVVASEADPQVVQQIQSSAPPAKPSKSCPPPSSGKPRIKRSKLLQSSNSSNALSGINSHIIMKNNATFLLDLSSSSNHNERSSSSGQQLLYSVSELTNMDPSPFPMTPFQCFNSLCLKESVLRDVSSENDEPGKQNSPASALSPLNNNIIQEGSVSPPEGFQSEEPHRRHKGPATQSSDANRSKRNSSCEEQIHKKKDDPDFFLSHPSHDLQKLFSQGNGGCVVSDILQRPVMSFVLQWNDLESLTASMTNSIRKASCRAYAIQALNWLLRSVSQPECLHDLLWFFVASLENSIVDVNNSNNDHYARKQQIQQRRRQNKANENVGFLSNSSSNNYFSPQFSGLNEHPSSDILTGGEAIQPFPPHSMPFYKQYLTSCFFCLWAPLSYKLP
ncbi:Putative E3 ubiquitinprotein ligase MYCBP2like [Caligus rogercresseyi]|uniref:E3 ubiquitinprotein ligase MYCBP2like n=1 Tax=Caligus rogercresseyi TaxID=217165 RepID=A0A7T8GVA3_CALRO|nr:Putative E3 ubiquitinprotein ligase MYCBP2like [Caligus rogercresseyi]